MRPIELTLRNFMSYREEATLDFARLKIACFAGDNGAGKSALLDAITWAIWGRTRAASDRDVISVGAPDMEVSFMFGVEDREYRIFRRRTAGTTSRQTLEFSVREPGGEEWFPITGDSIRQTERKIAETLNLDYETFVNSAFILQGRADSFAQIGPTDRKRILAEILNLDEYEQLGQMAREQERSVRAELNQAEGQRELLDTRLSERPARLAELEESSTLLTEVSEHLDRAESELKQLTSRLAAWEQLHDASERAGERVSRNERALATLDEQLEGLNVQKSERSDLLDYADEILAGAAAHRRWRDEAARLGEVALAARGEEQRVEQARREIEREEAGLRLAFDRHVTNRQHLSNQIEALERDAAQLERLREEARQASVGLARLKEARAESEDLVKERAGLQAANIELRRRMDEIKANLARVSGDVAECPVCRTRLTESDRLRIQGEWTADGTALGDAFRSNKGRIQQIDEVERQLKEELATLERLDRDYTRLQERIQLAEHARVECVRLNEESLQLTSMIAPIEATLVSGEFAAEARLRLAEAERSLAGLGYDRAAHDRAIAEERAHAQWEEREQRVERARIELAGIEQQIEGLNTQRSERVEELCAARAEVEALERQLAGQPDLTLEVERARDRRDNLEYEKSEVQTRFGAARHALEELDRLAAEREKVAARVQTLALDAGALKELVQAFGSNGIQALIVESVLPELEDEANGILRRMSSGSLRVSFRSQREALSVDKVIETLDILIRDEFGERPYALYSGGEAFRINFAVRVALSKLLAKRAGSRIDMLVIDEGFGSQDSRGRDGLIEAIRSIEPDFGTILAITHLGEIRELFPTRVDVVKTERGSTLSIVDS